MLVLYWIGEERTNLKRLPMRLLIMIQYDSPISFSDICRTGGQRFSEPEPCCSVRTFDFL